MFKILPTTTGAQLFVVCRCGLMAAAAAMESLDPLFMATVMLRHRRFEECVSLCDQLLQKSPLDQASGLKHGR